MAAGEEFNMKQEFAEVDFHEARLEERFRRTMETPGPLAREVDMGWQRDYARE